MEYTIVSRCPSCRSERDFAIATDNLGYLEYVEALTCEGGTEEVPCEYEPTTEQLIGVYHDHLDHLSEPYPEEED